MLGKTLAFIAALAPTAAYAHCCCDHREHVRYHHRAARVDGWDTASFEATAGRPCGNYPRSALRAQASGVTWVKLRVDEDGFVEASRISRSSGRADLDRAAIACVAGWHLGNGHEWRVARVSWRFHWHSWS
jgi:TonB family protein